MQEKRYDKFMDAFNHISGCIDSIYKELTKSAMSPLGGSAYLTLEDEDLPFLSGIKYHAMPPMKRFRDMELLSGVRKLWRPWHFYLLFIPINLHHFCS